VYSGKALYAFCEHAKKHPDLFRNKTLLFWHTGGALGAFDKAGQILPLLPPGQVARMKVTMPPTA
jgi:hypothetical protein